MNGLRDALVSAGVASSVEAKRIEALKRFAQEERESNLRSKQQMQQQASLLDLEEAESIREFRDKARKLLMERPDLIRDVIRSAHRFKDADGGKKLVWQFFQIRDTLAGVTMNERERFLKRALRAHGVTFEIPME